MIRDSELLFPRPTAEEVLSNLTDFFYTEALQGQAEKELQQRKEVVILLKERAKKGDIDIEDIARILQASPQAFNTLISLVGVSQERFLGMMTLKTVGNKKSGEPMSMDAVRSVIQKDREFASGVAAFLLYGKQDRELIGRVPPFDLAKLDKAKFLLKEDDLVDSSLR